MSSSIIHIFNSIVYQLSKIFNLKYQETPITRIQLLRDYFLDRLIDIEQKYPTRRIVIVLDSIDQLRTSDYSLEWFIDELPKNVKMIFSTLPNHGDILDNLKSRYPHLSRSDYSTVFIKIKSLTSSLANTIIQDWLVKSRRALSSWQMEVIDTMFRTNTLYPLYVKLIFDIVSKWPSFYRPDSEFTEANTIDSCIKYLFKSLEKTHGKLLFERSIIYMTSFKNGISENELEDILSLDDDVLYDIFEFHAPPVSFKAKSNIVV